MANYFTTQLEGMSDITLTMQPVNKGDEDIWFKIRSSVFTKMPPSASVRYLVVPYPHTYTDTQLSGFLDDRNTGNRPSEGIFFGKSDNNTGSSTYFKTSYLKIPGNTWENTEFDLYWLSKLNDDVYFSGLYSGVYSHPHNIQPEEVKISGSLLGNGENIQYSVTWDEITNADSADYSGVSNDPPDGPYWMRVLYKGQENLTTFSDDDRFPSGEIGSGIFYDSGYAGSGITFNLPFYVPDSNNQPAYYVFVLNNNGAGSDSKLQASPLKIDVNHGSVSNQSIGKFLQNWDSEVQSKADINKIQRVGEYPIEPGIIDRSRISVRIEDLAVRENSYVKQGTYISNYTNLDYNLYTFSLRVDEYIPNYENLSPNDVVSYYIQFNNLEWIKISPINRGEEYEKNALIPKLFVFDKPSADSETGSIRFIDLPISVNSYRVKIEFDLRSIPGSQFFPPEIRGYKAIMFDKSQFLNL